MTLQEKLEQKIKNIFYLPFVLGIQKMGGEVYIVGGAVRDYLRNQEPKDIDLIISKIPYEQLFSYLQTQGRAKLVGEAFGVILFETDGFSGEIALPRIDKKNTESKGHKSIIAQSDPYLPIEKDLKRRDFTINAIALYLDTKTDKIKLIDPFNGAKDIKFKNISHVDISAFSEDPLRLLRAIQFAARFNYDINPNTFEEIKRNAHLINEITEERILMEFEKVISKKGNTRKFIFLLKETNLFKNIFDFDFVIDSTIIKYIDVTKTIGELLFLCCFKKKINISKYCKDTFKINNNTEREIKALELVFMPGNPLQRKWNIFNALKIYPQILKSDLLFYNQAGLQFFTKHYPVSQKELKIDGNRLKSEFALREEQIGLAYKNMLDAIFLDKVNFRDTDYLLKYIK